MSREIILGKMISGETIIGKKNETDNGIAIDEAYLVNVVPNQNGQSFNVMLLPLFIPISKDAVDVPADKIIVTVTASKDIENEYIKATTNIVVPNGMPNEEAMSKVAQLHQKL